MYVNLNSLGMIIILKNYSFSATRLFFSNPARSPKVSSSCHQCVLVICSSYRSTEVLTDTLRVLRTTSALSSSAAATETPHSGPTDEHGPVHREEYARRRRCAASSSSSLRQKPTTRTKRRRYLCARTSGVERGTPLSS